MNNVTVALFEGTDTSAYTKPLWQYDYGQILKFEGIELPFSYEVHFSSVKNGFSVTQIGNADGVPIPDAFLQEAKNVYAWVYLHSGANDGETEYMVTIPVNKRAKPTNETPTPVQQDVITETIAALQTAVAECETNVTHYPAVVDDYWYVWDASAGEYVNTGVLAKGRKGDPGCDVKDDGNGNVYLTVEYTEDATGVGF